MAISRINLPRVPNERGVVPLCTVSSGTSPQIGTTYHIQEPYNKSSSTPELTVIRISPHY